jgi:hypothetical protein
MLRTLRNKTDKTHDHTLVTTRQLKPPDPSGRTDGPIWANPLYRGKASYPQIASTLSADLLAGSNS